MSSVRQVEDVAPLRHDEAMGLARTAYGRFADLLDELTPPEWATPTCCPGWTVREMAGHVLGSMRSSASIPEQVRQVRAARASGGPVADALSAVQVAATAALTPDEVRAQIRASIGRAVRGRRAIPAPLRHLVRIPVQLAVSGATEPWRLGYLVDVIVTRDTWMHRSDIAEATGRPFRVEAEHDGRLVELVVTEWARRHGRAVTLVLDGPAGGSYAQGRGGPEVRADAVAFCRALSGRGDAVPFGTEVPF